MAPAEANRTLLDVAAAFQSPTDGFTPPANPSHGEILPRLNLPSLFYPSDCFPPQHHLHLPALELSKLWVNRNTDELVLSILLSCSFFPFFFFSCLLHFFLH